jgi:hypothetical protein
VQRGRLGVQPHLLAQPRHQQQAGDLADARLDRRQADQLAVQLVEQFLYVRFTIGVSRSIWASLILVCHLFNFTGKALRRLRR